MNEMQKLLSLFAQSVRSGLILFFLLATLLTVRGSASPADAKPTHPQFTKVTTVSAASYVGEVVSGSIATAFGVNLASSTASATTIPLPTELAGTMVRVGDSAGVERFAPLFFVSPGQINYLIPPSTSRDLASVTVFNNGEIVARGNVLIADVAPGVFAANGNGQGVANAVLLRIRADGTRLYEPVVRFDAAQQRFVSVPIDLGPAGDEVFLILFGTGFIPLYTFIEITATVGGTDTGKVYAGPQGDFAGLDQINVHLPRSLIGRGEVNVSIALVGKAANTVTVNIQ